VQNLVAGYKSCAAPEPFLAKIAIKVKKLLDLRPLHGKGYLRFTFIEHPTFTKQIESLFTDDEYRRLQTDLAANPESGDVIPGLAGLRKLRWGAKGKGKRGGARIIYLLIPKPGLVYLFYAYTKDDITDMSSDQKKRLAKAVEEIKKEHQK
jgi:mRNA-degrading endonuclease RelE of RelBE toxin-antitoxin system